MLRIFVALDTSHRLRSSLKASAEWNMRRKVVTFDTVHFEISPLKWVA